MADREGLYDAQGPNSDKELLLPEDDNTGFQHDIAHFPINGDIVEEDGNRAEMVVFGIPNIARVFSVILLTAINLLNYMDRFTVAGMVRF